ncbi:MAG: ocd, partial [Gemmatimonadetes bacterium]|nr:ocd [Gemmatimonadota bacterium]
CSRSRTVSDVLILDQADVTALLPLDVCIAAMRDAFAALARGDVTMPLRQMLRLPDDAGVLGAMPAYDASTGALGIKVLTAPARPHAGLDSHQGAVLLFDRHTGVLDALVDATAITALRTAAVSAVATDLLARPDADDLAMLGAGTQAATHLEAMRLVRPLRRVRVWSRSLERAHSFARDASRRFGCDVEAMSSVRDALAGAGIVCTTTASRTPIVERQWLAAGAHVNAVGSSAPTARELDTRTVVDASLFVDRRESALREAGDFLIPLGEGAVTPAHIRAELGELVIGAHPGRTSATELTLFKSLGLGLEDVAAARVAVARARAQGMGVQCEFVGRPYWAPTPTA